MKSDTYQKEGWFVLEDESRVFGQDAESSEDNKNENIKNTKISVSDHSDKEDITKTNADKAIEDFLSYVDGLIENEPEPSEEEVRSGIDKILAKAYPEKNKKKKVTVKKVLLLVALLAILSGLSAYVAANYRNISTENGFLTRDNGTIQITFFGEDEEEYISVDTLLADLAEHGYEDIMFPEAFLFDDKCKVSVPRYSISDEIEQASFDVYKNDIRYTFCINNDSGKRTVNFHNLDNAKTIVINDTYLYVFDYGSEDSSINFVNEEYRYYITASIPYTEMVTIAETIK